MFYVAIFANSDDKNVDVFFLNIYIGYLGIIYYKYNIGNNSIFKLTYLGGISKVIMT